MDLFNKNPFTNNNTNQTKIVGNNIQFDEKQKLENIRENMNSLKFPNLNKTNEVNQNQELKQSNLQERMESLRNINK